MAEIDIHQYLVSDITDTVGAARILKERLKRSVGVDTVHKLVREGKLRAWMFQDGELVERDPRYQTRGKDLIFLKADLAAMKPPARPGNPKIADLHKSRRSAKIDKEKA